MTREQQLERQVAVLREALSSVAREDYRGYKPRSIDVANQALTESDRIAAEPVEATDWEVVAEWSDGGNWYAYRCRGEERHEVDMRGADGSVRAFCGCVTAAAAFAKAAAWVRAQGVQP